MVKSDLVFQTQNSDALEQTQRAKRVGVGGIFRRLKAHLDVALCGEIIDLRRLHFLNDADEIGGVGQVAVMQEKPRIRQMRVAIKMIDALGVEGRGSSFDAMDLVAFVNSNSAR